MKKSDIRTLTENLQARQAAITNNASKRKDIVVQQAPDAFDQVQLNAERDLTVTLLNHEAILLNNLSAALRRIADGSYGICEQCDEEISPKRLKAVPWAMLCLNCQEKSDRGHSNVGAVLSGVDRELRDRTADPSSSILVNHGTPISISRSLQSHSVKLKVARAQG